MVRRTGTATVAALADGYVLFGNLGGVLWLVTGFDRGRAAQAFGEGRQGPGNRGLGIGLYTVQVLTENVDGSIIVDDNDPGGAVVTVELQPPDEPLAGRLPSA